MKATLEFNLPEEQKEHLRCIKSLDMAIVLFDIQYNLRKKLIKESTPSGYEQGVLDIIYTITELMEEQGINIDELIE